MNYDIKIVGGTIVDGSGQAGYAGDVGIKDGKVVALGQAPGDARQTIDAVVRLLPQALSTSTPTTTPKSFGIAC